MVITIFTCTKLADLGDPGLCPVVEIDSWRLHNDTSEKVLPIQWGIQEFALDNRCSTRTDPNCHCIHSRPPTFDTVLKGSFLNVEMADIRPWPVSTRKKQTFKVEYPRQRQHSEGRFQITLPLFGAFFHVTILEWCYTILKSMRIIPLPLSNNI